MTLLADLTEIENRLEIEGDTESVRRSFWRIIGQIKRQKLKDLDDVTIQKAVELRNRLFRQKVLLSVKWGLFFFLFIAIMSILAFIWNLLYLELIILGFMFLPPIVMVIILNVILLLSSLFVLYGAYPIGRYVGGRIANVGFDGFYRFSPGELGLKIEYSSYLKTTQSRRKWVFGFPIIWVAAFLTGLCIIALFLNPAGVWGPFSFLIILPISYYALTLRKTGELYRFLRERRIEQELKKQATN